MELCLFMWACWCAKPKTKTIVRFKKFDVRPSRSLYYFNIRVLAAINAVGTFECRCFHQVQENDFLSWQKDRCFLHYSIWNLSNIKLDIFRGLLVSWKVEISKNFWNSLICRPTKQIFLSIGVYVLCVWLWKLIWALHTY